MSDILQFFKGSHLPEDLKEISEPFGKLALWVNAILPDNAERSVALRKLLEAKDAAVRAAISRSPTRQDFSKPQTGSAGYVQGEWCDGKL